MVPPVQVPVWQAFYRPQRSIGLEVKDKKQSG
jgi:hypothetical protein